MLGDRFVNLFSCIEIVFVSQIVFNTFHSIFLSMSSLYLSHLKCYLLLSIDTHIECIQISLKLSIGVLFPYILSYITDPLCFSIFSIFLESFDSISFDVLFFIEFFFPFLPHIMRTKKMFCKRKREREKKAAPY